MKLKLRSLLFHEIEPITMQLSKEELIVINDTEFLITKARVIENIWQLLEQTKSEIKQYLKKESVDLPSNIDLEKGKISRGENYLLLPYLVLDYPAVFSKENIMAYRTMFWWGNFFSFTLHLQGKSLENHRLQIINKFENLIENEVYISTGTTPWQYHYQEDNYKLIDYTHLDHIQKATFLKLSKKISINDYKKVLAKAVEFLSFLLKDILVEK